MNQLPRLLIERVEPAIEPEHDGDTCSCGSVNYTRTVGGRRCDRLLKVDVLAGLARSNHQRRVKMSGSAHNYRVDVFPR